VNTAELMKALTDDTARAKLPQRANDAPYYAKVGPGQFIGFRPAGATWCARLRAPLPVKAGEQPRFEQRYKTLGTQASYQLALTAAWAWIGTELGRKPRNAPSDIITVADCCTKYVESLRLTGAKDEQRIKRAENILRNATADAIGSVECEKLTALDVNEWRERLLRGERFAADARFNEEAEQQAARPLLPASVNRIKKQLFAALSWAADGGRIINRQWQIKSNLTEEIERPGLFIEPAHRAQLLAAAEGEFKQYLLCVMSTGARMVELKRATRASLDLTKQVPAIKFVSYKGRGAKRRERVTHIPAEARAAFAHFAAGKIGMAPLFNINRPADKFKALAVACGLPQYELYDTRHTRIATLLSKGTDAQTVAEECGTSLQMIDRHYRKYMPEDAAAKVAAVGI